LHSAAEEKGTAEIIRDYGIPNGVFEELPAVPADFNKIVSLMHKNIFKNYDFFSKDYWLQPEFYPSFRQNGLEYWQKADATRYGVAGIGFFPATQAITMKRGSEKTTAFFVHAAFGARTFQGIKLKAVATGNADGLSVELLDAEFLLGPSFPKFSSSWANRVRAKITASSEAKSGSYDLTFETVAPSAENSEKWRAESQGNYFETAKAGAEMFETITVKVE